MEFLYDHTGVFAVIFNGTTYFYRKNAQGGIIAILDSEGRVVVKYTYDAWGNIVTEVLDCNANIPFLSMEFLRRNLNEYYENENM